MNSTRRLAVAALLAATAPAQTITLAEGTPTSLSIVALPESNPAAAGTVVAQDVELLPIEITARTLAQASDATRSRRVERNGLVRVELPDGGRLFRFRRAGGQFWGFLHVAADGAPRIVLERSGAGPAGTADPFRDRIGVAADGQHAAVALAAGGLLVVRLDGGVYASTGRADRTLVATGAVRASSVMVGPDSVYWQTTNEQLWRCDADDGALPTDVSPPAVPAGEFKDQMVLSRDGSTLVFLYGPDDLQRLWRLAPSGAATVLPPPPSKYEEPGYLPEDPGEPAMLLADDGSRLFFVDSDVRDELWLLDVGGSLPALQITSDVHFQPYIGAHILPKFAGPRLAVAIGDPAQMDWFRAELTAQGGTVTNLTNTGSLAQPFAAGALAPVQAADVGGTLLVTDQQPAGLALLGVDVQNGGFATLQQGLLGQPEPGSSIGSPAPADVLVRAASGERLYAGGTGASLADLPPGILLTPPAHGPFYAATWVHLANDWGALFVYVPGLLLNGPLEFGVEQVATTATGGIVVVGNALRYLAPGVFVPMNRPPVALRRCLSGAGV